MEPASIAIACFVFLVCVALYSICENGKIQGKNAEIHKKAKEKALKKELFHLEKILRQERAFKPVQPLAKFELSKVESTSYLEDCINIIFMEKLRIIENYDLFSTREIHALIQNSVNLKKHKIYQSLSAKNNKIFASYDKDIIQLQARRASQWHSNGKLMDRLVDQENTRNNHINFLYKKYQSLIEKLYCNIQGKDSISRDEQRISYMRMADWDASMNIDLSTSKKEKIHRIFVQSIERAINEDEYMPNDLPNLKEHSLEHA